MQIQHIIQEYKVANHHFCLADDFIIYVHTIGEIDDKLALKCKDTLEKLYTLVEGEIRVLVDLNKAGKQSAKARRVWSELTDQREKPVKVALWGMHPVARIIAFFYIGLTGNKKCRFFSNREKAMEWLNEKS